MWGVDAQVDAMEEVTSKECVSADAGDKGGRGCTARGSL